MITVQHLYAIQSRAVVKGGTSARGVQQQSPGNLSVIANLGDAGLIVIIMIKLAYNISLFYFQHI